MEYTYYPEGVCSQEIKFSIVDEKIENLTFTGGCPGNLFGIKKLVEGLSLEEVISKFKGIKCGSKSTSCPDQLVKAISEYMNSNK